MAIRNSHAFSLLLRYDNNLRAAATFCDGIPGMRCISFSPTGSFILTSFAVAAGGRGQGVLVLKILVCMKQVPQKDAPLQLNENGTWIREDVPYEVNEPDAYALEEALRQREKHKG